MRKAAKSADSSVEKIVESALAAVKLFAGYLAGNRGDAPAGSFSAVQFFSGLAAQLLPRDEFFHDVSSLNDKNMPRRRSAGNIPGHRNSNLSSSVLFLALGAPFISCSLFAPFCSFQRRSSIKCALPVRPVPPLSGSPHLVTTGAIQKSAMKTAGCAQDAVESFKR